jgi:hypothetical protein
VEFRHPQTGQAIRFLSPDSWIGTLVKVAVSEYIRYFNVLKQGALPQTKATKEQVAQVAAAAIQRSMVMMMSPLAEWNGRMESVSTDFCIGVRREPG